MTAASIARLGDANRHFWLTRSVARAMNLSLGEAVIEGEMAAEGYCDMVNRCRQCLQVSACESWLGAQVEDARAAPQFCPNHEIYNQLKAGRSRTTKDV
ncbi:DUF6455 family protein [Litorivita sp. NS0012-18]|uniref:DUF6455 family protein n=1 Tax=Litorivita sp. NS0012-18 TaxID=3127655 RepID=UPI003104BB3B